MKKLLKSSLMYITVTVIMIVVIVLLSVYIPIEVINQIFMLLFIVFVIGVMSWLVIVMSIDMHKTNKEAKIREAEEALRRKLRAKYNPILDGLCFWCGDRKFICEYHQYAKIFTAEYGNSEYCVKTDIDINGAILEKYTVPGYILGFESPNDEVGYRRLVDKLISRINEANNE